MKSAKRIPTTAPLLAFLVRNPSRIGSEWVLALWVIGSPKSWIVK